LIGKSLVEMQFRNTYRVTLIAVLRTGTLIEHPEPNIIFQQGDTIYIMGKPDQIADAVELLTRKEKAPK
jgi:CPA2 family monovalent cation:H+ antiporter-2